jgi:hypothetical protein
MKPQIALKVVLALVGVLFLALSYPMIVFMRQAPALSMMFSLYVTLGVFLLLATRNPQHTEASSPSPPGQAWCTPSGWVHRHSAIWLSAGN